MAVRGLEGAGVSPGRHSVSMGCCHAIVKLRRKRLRSPSRLLTAEGEAQGWFEARSRVDC